MMCIIFVYFSLINCDLVLYFTGLIKLFQVNFWIIITFKINTLLLEFKFCENHI